MKYIAITAGNADQFRQYLYDHKIEYKQGQGLKDDNCYIYVHDVQTACGYHFFEHISVGTDYENGNNRNVVKLIQMHIRKT